MKSIFQVRRPPSGCEHICWTESGGNQIMGAVQWDIDNKCQRQSNEQRGMKDRRTSGGKRQWYWITDKCCIWYSDTVENKVLFWCILCYRCLFLLAMIQFKEELPWHYHLALINHDPNDDDDYEPISFRLPIIPVNGGWLWHYLLA